MKLIVPESCRGYCKFLSSDEMPELSHWLSMFADDTRQQTLIKRPTDVLYIATAADLEHFMDHLKANFNVDAISLYKSSLNPGYYEVDF